MPFALKLLLATLFVVLSVLTSSSSAYYGYEPGYHYPAFYSGNKSHDLITGLRQPGDRLVYQENIVKTSRWLRVLETIKTFNLSAGYIITQVRALDRKTNGNGAFASQLRGGTGYNSVTLKFKSQRGHGINFVVQIFARSRFY